MMLDKDPHFLLFFFSLFASKKIVITMRTCDKGTRQMGLKNWEFLSC